jgi:hypothetical protein
MKILFLDNDGVICLSSQWGGRDKKMKKFIKQTGISEIKLMPAHIRLDSFDKKSVKVLNEVIEKTGAEIVVSSDWKLHATLEELQELYLENGVIKAPIATTENMKDFDPETNGLFCWKGWIERIRVVEIEKYLKENLQVTHWVAIDDLFLGKHTDDGPGLENFVLTRRPMSEGIKQSGIKEELLKYLL